MTAFDRITNALGYAFAAIVIGYCCLAIVLNAIGV
jgi:hypothetical protein